MLQRTDLQNLTLQQLQAIDEVLDSYLCKQPQYGEGYHKSYRKNRKSFDLLVKQTVQLKRILRNFFQGQKQRIESLVHLHKIVAADTNEHINTASWDIEDTNLANTLADGIFPIYTNGAKTTAENIGIGTTIDSSSAPSQKFLSNYVLKLAGNLNDTTKADIKQAIQTSLALGEKRDELTARINNILDDPYRSEMIAQTESIRAYSEGRLATLQEIGYDMKQWEWPGNSDCPICPALQDLGPIPIDDTFPTPAFGDVNGPPAHPWSILPNQEIEALDIFAKMISPYNGLAIDLTTRSGIRLSVTEKHPMATSRGWIFASKLQVGDYLLSTPNGIQGMQSAINPNGKTIKSLIDNVIVSGNVRLAHVPISSINFNSKTRFNKYIHIIFSNSKLRLTRYVSGFKFSYKKNFSLRNIWQSFLIGFGSFNQFRFTSLSSFTGNMSFVSPFFPLFRSQTFITNNQNFTDSSYSDSKLLELFGKEVSINTNLFSKMIDRFSGIITLDEIVDIKVRHYEGTVYDLTTDYSFYTVNNIITHNCQCNSQGIKSSQNVSGSEIKGSWITKDGRHIFIPDGAESIGSLQQQYESAHGLTLLTQYNDAMNKGDYTQARIINDRIQQADSKDPIAAYKATIGDMTDRFSAMNSEKTAIDFSKESAIKETLYHGSNEQTQQNIQKGGFQTDPEGAYGKGVYFTTNPNDALDFGTNVTNAKVNVGTVKTLADFQDMVSEARNLNLSIDNLHNYYASNFDAVKVVKDGYVVVFDPAKAMPFK